MAAPAASSKIDLACRIERGPIVIAADLTQPEPSRAIGEALAAAGAEAQYVVNNAGFGLVGSAAKLDRVEQLQIIDVNQRALTDLSLAFVPSLERHRGGILNVGSVAGFLPGPGMAVYHATKAYLLSFTEALHEELKADGVRVCALCPGPVNTGFFARAGMARDYFPAFLRQSANQVARVGYEGFMGGHRVVVPGRPNRILTLLPRLVPRWLVLAFMARRWRLTAGG